MYNYTTIGIIHKKLIESQIHYTTHRRVSEHVGVGLEHHRADVKTESPRKSSYPLQLEDRQ